jgi:translocator protein
VAIAGAIVSDRGMSWYERLDRASFNPPDAVFAPVWSALYTINAIAGYLAWRATTRPAPTVAWAVGLALNLLWTLVFFGAHRPALGLVVIAGLWIAIVAFAALARPHDATATWLMMPYLSWVTFAGLLDLAVATGN